MTAMFTPAQNAYRFYADDGSESGSTALGTQSTPLSRDVTADSNVVLRIRIQETGGANGATTDDWQLQRSLNGGAFANVTTSSTVARAFSSSNLTDGGTTTNRLGAGTGSFVAGEISEVGLVTDRQLTASNYTEMLYTVTLRSADVANSDAVTFRLLFNGATFTYNSTPTINVTKVAPTSADQWAQPLSQPRTSDFKAKAFATALAAASGFTPLVVAEGDCGFQEGAFQDGGAFQVCTLHPKWQNPLSEPTRRKGPSTALILASGAYAPVYVEVVAENVTMDKWYRPLIDPTLRKRTQGPTIFETPPRSVDFQRWYSPLSEPTRRKGLPTPEQPSFTVGLSDTARDHHWYPPLSTPTRRLGLPTPEQPSGCFVKADPFPENVSADRWAQPLSEPTRRKGLSTDKQPTGAFVKGAPFPESVTADRWAQPLSVPTRRGGLTTDKQSTGCFVKADPFPEDVSADRWAQPLSDPTRAKPRIQPDAQAWSYYTPPDVEVVTVDKWWRELSQPRFPIGLATSNQPQGGLVKSDPFPENVSADRWEQPFSQPTRRKGLPTPEQPQGALAQPDVADFRWIAPLSEPTRRRGLPTPEQPTGAFVGSDTARDARWFSPLAEPTRRKSTIQPDGLSWSTFTPTTETLDRWWRDLDQPRFPRGLGTPNQPTGAMVKADPFPENVSADRWAQPLSDPTRRKNPVPYQDELFFVGSDTAREHGWRAPLSEPTRRKARPDQPYFTIGLADPARDFWWFSPLAEPTRRVRGIQPDGLAWSYFTPAQVAPLDTWFAGLAQPTIAKPRIQPDAVNWLRYTDTDQLLSWHSPFSIPTLRVRFAEQPAFTRSYYFPPEPDITVDKWHMPLAVPTRRLGLATAQQPQGALVKSDPFPETVTADRWAQPLSQPTRRGGLATGLQPAGTFTQFDPAREQQWYQPLAQPTRRGGLATNLQAAAAVSFIPSDVARDQARFLPLATPTRRTISNQPDGLTWSGFTPSTEVVTVDKWLTALSLPTKLGGFGAHLQNGFFWFNYPIPVVPPGTPSDSNRLFIANVGTLMGQA